MLWSSRFITSKTQRDDKRIHSIHWNGFSRVGIVQKPLTDILLWIFFILFPKTTQNVPKFQVTVISSRITWKYVNTLSLNSLCDLLLGVFPQRSAHQIEIDNNESNWDWIVDWFDSNAQCQVNNCIAFALPLPFCVGVAVVVDVWISFYIYFGLICRLWRCSLKNPVSIKCRWLGGEIPNFLLQLNKRKIFNFRKSSNEHRHRHTDIHTPTSCDFFLFFRPSNMVIMFEWPDAVQMNDKNKPTGNAK